MPKKKVQAAAAAAKASPKAAPKAKAAPTKVAAKKVAPKKVAPKPSSGRGGLFFNGAGAMSSKSGKEDSFQNRIFGGSKKSLYP